MNGLLPSTHVRIAHLILAHKDPEINARVVRRLCEFSDVFIHIDKNSDVSCFEKLVEDTTNCFFIQKRLHCEWGGWNAIVAEIALIEAALAKGKYDRIVFLQGLDYPIKSNESIQRFFDENPETEFIRGCNCSISKEWYFRRRCRQLWFLNNQNCVKRFFQRIMSFLHIELRSGYIHYDGKRWPVFWGSAQWALTAECAQWIVDFFHSHGRFNRWFYYSFPVDELYFATVVMNSEWAQKTTNGGPETEKKGLVNWRNLHYFEYPKQIKIFTAADYELLTGRPELYCRKVTSELSMRLLDMLDSDSVSEPN